MANNRFVCARVSTRGVRPLLASFYSRTPTLGISTVSHCHQRPDSLSTVPSVDHRAPLTVERLCRLRRSDHPPPGFRPAISNMDLLASPPNHQSTPPLDILTGAGAMPLPLFVGPRTWPAGMSWPTGLSGVFANRVSPGSGPFLMHRPSRVKYLLSAGLPKS